MRQVLCVAGNMASLRQVLCLAGKMTSLRQVLCLAGRKHKRLLLVSCSVIVVVIQ